MILGKILEKKIKRLEEKKRVNPTEVVYDRALNAVKNSRQNLFKEAIGKKNSNLAIIGEFKKASPSKGVILEKFDIQAIHNYYIALGIDAFSVLTEEDFFLGNDKYIKEIEGLSNHPILRKDFIIDFYQIYESVVLGADAILLIVGILGEKLQDFYREAIRFKLQPLVEVHNKEELDLALKCDCEIIGINNRDLRTFKTSLEVTKNLKQYIPENKIVVSESGINSIEDLKTLRDLGLDAVLIGEMFMRNIKNDSFIQGYKDFRYDGN